MERGFCLLAILLALTSTTAAQSNVHLSNYFEEGVYSRDQVQAINPTSAPSMNAAPQSPVPASKPVAAQPEKEKPPTEAEMDKKIAGAHKLSFFDNDFSYLKSPYYKTWYPGDLLKNRSLFGMGTLDIGGQYRARFHQEQNLRGLGLTGIDDQFLLHRTRVYSDWKLNSGFRVYAEMIDAESNFENFAPRIIEVNRTDMLNLFFDKQLWEGDNGKLVARVGRQDLNFGAQRLVSVLDWANTRRLFEGYDLRWQGKLWDVDAFWVHPVRINPVKFDSPDLDQEFSGVYSKYKGWKGEQFDIYGFRYLNGFGVNHFTSNTVGARWQGEDGSTLWDNEVAYQFGENTDGSAISAAMITAGAGQKLATDGWKPVLWCYYDWASGDNSLGAANGFNHLFPLAHRYLGFMDFYGRGNISAPNLLLTANPHDNWQLLLWYHYFMLANRNDTPYSVGNVPFNPANAPASRELGHEIDFLSTWKLNPRNELAIGYSHFFSGRYYRETVGIPFRGDANFYYVQYTLNF